MRMIKVCLKRWAFLSCVVMFVSISSRAETVNIVTTGIGQTPEDSVQAALKSAVEQVVGQVVDTSTLVENEEVISDKILTYSGGYVEGYETIKEPAKANGGLFSVKINARVKKTALVEKLKAENITITVVSGGSMFGQLLTKQKQSADAAEILTDEFKDVPSKFLTAKVDTLASGEPAVSIDEITGQVGASIKLEIDLEAYKAWFNRVSEKLDKIADAKHVEVVKATWGGPPISYSIPQQLAVKRGEENLLIAFVSEQSPDGCSIKFHFYKLAGGKAKTVKEMLDSTLQAGIKINATMQDGSGNMIGHGVGLMGTTVVVDRQPQSMFALFYPAIGHEAELNAWGTKMAYRDTMVSPNDRPERKPVYVTPDNLADAQRKRLQGLDSKPGCAVQKRLSTALDISFGAFRPEQLATVSKIVCEVVSNGDGANERLSGHSPVFRRD